MVKRLKSASAVSHQVAECGSTEHVEAVISRSATQVALSF